MKERFQKTFLFEKPDKVLFCPGLPRESTLAAWHKQGLPEGIDYYEALLDVLGIEGTERESQEPRLDELGVSFAMIPTFEEKILEHKNGHYIVQDWMGAIVEISDKYDYTYIRSAKDFVTRRWLKSPVQNRQDWESMKTRYDPRASNRYPGDFKHRCKALQDRNYPIGFNLAGPFWQLREWLGFENLCMLTIEDPDWIQEIVNFWANFVSEVMTPILTRIKVDFVMISEDMAYKTRSMISPEMVRQFLLPTYQRWVTEIRKSGCPLISLDSDGYVSELIPIWIEAGINCCEPMEVAAGNNLVEYRRVFGNKMAYRGGIDKRAIAKGGRIMEREVMRVVLPLLKKGGFAPGCDHGVPSDISWPNFVKYSRLLAKLTGWL